MLLVVGPQGAGNHLWSKIFSLHKDVYGWKSLLENYWEPHRFKEPFAECWKNPKLLEEFDWTISDNFFTSISVPLGIHDSDENPIYTPVIKNFTEKLDELGIEYQVAVIGRDQTILKYQQTRIRTKPTYQMFLDQLTDISNPIFLSYELLYFYKAVYLQSLNTIIPVNTNNEKLDEILGNDANVKYIHSINYNELDSGNKTGRIFKKQP